MEEKHHSMTHQLKKSFCSGSGKWPLAGETRLHYKAHYIIQQSGPASALQQHSICLQLFMAWFRASAWVTWGVNVAISITSHTLLSPGGFHHCRMVLMSIWEPLTERQDFELWIQSLFLFTELSLSKLLWPCHTLVFLLQTLPLPQPLLLLLGPALSSLLSVDSPWASPRVSTSISLLIRLYLSPKV